MWKNLNLDNHDLDTSDKTAESLEIFSQRYEEDETFFNSADCSPAKQEINLSDCDKIDFLQITMRHVAEGKLNHKSENLMQSMQSTKIIMQIRVNVYLNELKANTNHTEVKIQPEMVIDAQIFNRNPTKGISNSGIAVEMVNEFRLSLNNYSSEGLTRRIIFIVVIIISGISPGYIGCEGSVMIKPKNIIVLAGNNATFNCSSDLTDQPIWWYHSGARQQEVKQVSDESSIKEEFRARYASRVVPSTNPKQKISELTIKNVTMADGGSIYCKDDGDFGTYQLAKLSVATEIRCSAACVDDHLLVSCSAYYWSEDDLHFELQLLGDLIKSNFSSRLYNEARACIEYEAIWSIKMSCESAKDEIIVALKENSTNVELPKSDASLLKVFVKESKIFTSELPRTTSVFENLVTGNGHSEEHNNMKGAGIKYPVTIIAVLTTSLVLTIVILIAVISLSCKKSCCKRKSELSDTKPHDAMEEMQHLTDCNSRPNTCPKSGLDATIDGIVKQKDDYRSTGLYPAIP